MSLPVFLADDLTGERVVLRGAEGRHAARVRRLDVGEAVQLVDGRGTRVTGAVVELGRDTLTVDVRERAFEPVAVPRLVLVQALAKGDRGELAVELATEVGVDEVVPWAASRCVVRWEGERGAKARSRWQSAAREAAKQSRRSWVPEVTDPVSTAGLVARLHAGGGVVLHQGAAARLTSLPLPVTAELLLVVGPEGGISDEELALLTGAGAAAVRLGASVLRTSTAGAVAAAVLSARTGRW